MQMQDDGSCQFCESPFEGSIHLEDDYGDGWNGNVLTMLDFDGNVLLEGITLFDGSFQVQNFCLEQDPSECFYIVVDGGSYQNEVSWTIKDENDNILIEGGAPYDGYFGGVYLVVLMLQLVIMTMLQMVYLVNLALQ